MPAQSKDDTRIASLRKSARLSIIASFRTFTSGARLFDLRTYETRTHGEKQTERGITTKPSQLIELRNVIDKAIAKAREEGLI